MEKQQIDFTPEEREIIDKYLPLKDKFSTKQLLRLYNVRVEKDKQVKSCLCTGSMRISFRATFKKWLEDNAY